MGATRDTTNATQNVRLTKKYAEGKRKENKEKSKEFSYMINNGRTW